VPIRTPRGRSAAYRGIWQWPLRSPARLTVTVVAVLVVAVGVTIGIGMLVGPGTGGLGALPPIGAGPSVGPASGSGTTTSGPTGTAAGVVPTSAPSPLPLSAAPAEALAAAERWARAWVRPEEGTSSAQWLAGLRPITTEEYLGVLSGVDPQNIPATRVTGEPEAVRVAERSVQVEIPTDALTLRVLVVDTEAGWRVAGYDRA
jgi:hypothetical protein